MEVFFNKKCSFEFERKSFHVVTDFIYIRVFGSHERIPWSKKYSIFLSNFRSVFWNFILTHAAEPITTSNESSWTLTLEATRGVFTTTTVTHSTVFRAFVNV